MAVDLNGLQLTFLIHEALIEKSATEKFADYLRSQEKGVTLTHHDCCLLADLVTGKRRRGRPKTRKNGAPSAVRGNTLAVMYRFAVNCFLIGQDSGFADRAAARDEVCSAFGICKRDFETIHAQSGWLATKWENDLKNLNGESDSAK